jgi:hypothetical protein
MAQMSYEDFSKSTETRQMSTNSQGQNFSSVTYFALTDDGSEAIVRFNIADINDLTVHSRHSVNINGKRRNVECLRTPNEPLDKCPLCAAGEKVAYRIYVPLVKYEIVDGKVEAQACIWDQPARFRETLKSYAMDYGDLRDYLFKVVRHGKKGDPSTTYVLLPANPNIYKPEVYVQDFSSFDNYSLNRGVILNKTAEEMAEYLRTGEFPLPQEYTKKEQSKLVEEKTPVNQAVYQQPVQPRVVTSAAPVRSYQQEASTSEQHPEFKPRRYTY